MDPVNIQIRPQLQQLRSSQHAVTHIVEVKFSEAPSSQETLFFSIFGCSCCPRRRDWLTKEILIAHYGVEESKILEIEY